MRISSTHAVMAGLVFGTILTGLLAAPVALAQEARQCPRLPSGSALRWEEMRNPDLLFCKALEADGTQAFSVMISRESPFKPSRTLREESATINGQSTYWYRTEIAARPELLTRETQITLADGNIAYLNVQATSAQRMQQSIGVISNLGF